MDSETPLVSAIIPTKNRAELLERAVRSVMDQTYPHIEIIIVNDGSTDGTADTLESLKKQTDRKFKIITNDHSVGAAQARNQAIEAAEGEFIAGLDDDDTWHEQRIEALLDAYSDEYACVCSDIIMVYPKARIPWNKKNIIDLETLLFTNQVGNQVLVKTERLREVGGFDVQLSAAQDYDLWIRLCAAYGPIYNVQRPLQRVYVDHSEEQITHSAPFEGYLQFYKKHKYEMNRRQRKYQLYNIRRAQNKPETIKELVSAVPPNRYLKEMRRWFANRFFKR